MGKLKYLIIAAVVALAMCVALTIYLYFGCSYSGTEFSPDDFTIRNFSYRYEPVTGRVISGRAFEKDYAFSMPDLVADKYVKPIFKKEKTWHLIQDSGHYFRGHSSDSDARFLVEFLGLYDENYENRWTVWNSDNPKLAKVLWPLIAEMARDEIYLTVSDVLTFALDSEHKDAKKFKTDLRQEVAKAYLKLGKIDFENSDLKSAEYRVKKAMKYHSDDETKALLKKIRSSKPLAESPIPSPE